MRKRVCSLFLAILCAASFTGCKTAEKKGAGDSKTERVELTVWGAEEDAELMEQIIQGFQSNYQGQADFNITFEVQSESECKNALIGGLEAGADVFTFADDQLNSLAAAGAVDPIEPDEEIRNKNLESAVEAASIGDMLYAYPLTADNGYFL